MKVDFNADADHIDIPIKKYNLTGYFFLLLCVSTFGCCCIISPSTFVVHGGHGYNYPFEIFIMGLFLAIVTLPCVVVLLYRLMDFRPGLIINEDGIINHSSVLTSGLIRWEDISAISNEDDDYPVSIIIYVNNPVDFIQQYNGIKRYVASNNYKKYGGPIVIDGYQLKCDYAELSSFLIDTLKVYKNATEHKDS